MNRGLFFSNYVTIKLIERKKFNYRSNSRAKNPIKCEKNTDSNLIASKITQFSIYVNATQNTKDAIDVWNKRKLKIQKEKGVTSKIIKNHLLNARKNLNLCFSTEQCAIVDALVCRCKKQKSQKQKSETS